MRPLSASGVKLWRSCPRRFTFRYVEGLEQEKTDATNLGTEVHAEMEAWIKKGTLPTHPLALKLLGAFANHPHYPAKGRMGSEEEFTLTIAGVNWRGVIDGRKRDGDTAVVVDFKTCKDINRYALRAEGGLLVSPEGEPDVQATLYAAKEYVQGATKVLGIWAYVSTGANPKPPTRLVEVEFDRDKVEEVYAGLHADALDVQVLYAIRPKAAVMPYRASACLSFNRPCEYTALCNKPAGLFVDQPLNLDQHPETHVKNFLDSIKNSLPPSGEDEAPPPPVDEDDAPPPPPEDDMPPAPPEDEELEAERLVEEYMASQRTPKAAPRTVESGFVNPPEAAGKVPYATPEEAAVGEGVTSPSTNNLVAVLEASLLSATEAECGGADGAAEEVARLEDELEKVKPKARKTRAKKTDKTPQHEVAVVDTKGFTVVEGHDFDTGTGDRIEDTACEPQPLTSDELEAIVEATAELTTDTIQDDIRRIIREELKAFFTGLGK